MKRVASLLVCLVFAACNRSEEPAAKTQASKAEQVQAASKQEALKAEEDKEPAKAEPAKQETGEGAQKAEGEAAASEEAKAEGEAAEENKPAYSQAMLNPDKANLKAPAKYTVRLKTTRGDVLIDVTRDWAPLAADRFYNLVKMGFFTDVAFFRVIAGFMAQAGVHGDPKINEIWGHRSFKDEAPKQSNTRGMVSFAAAGKDSRATQFFINFADNSRLDHYPPSGFVPFGKVRRMTAMNRIYAGYGEGAPMGRGPDQTRLNKEGNAYLAAEFPQLDYIKEAVIEE